MVISGDDRDSDADVKMEKAIEPRDITINELRTCSRNYLAAAICEGKISMPHGLNFGVYPDRES